MKVKLEINGRETEMEGDSVEIATFLSILEGANDETDISEIDFSDHPYYSDSRGETITLEEMDTNWLANAFLKKVREAKTGSGFINAFSWDDEVHGLMGELFRRLMNSTH